MSDLRQVVAFASPTLRELQAHLLADTPLETACFVLARSVRTPSNAYRLVVFDMVELGPRDYAERTTSSIQLVPTAVARVMRQARAEGASVLWAHSHPFAGFPSPSPRDRAGETTLLPAFMRRIPGVPHGRIIVSPGAIHSAIFTPDGVEHSADVMEVGPEVILHRAGADGRHGCDARFDRQVLAFGALGQQRLRQMRVAVVGLGGTGSLVIQQLAHLGTHEFLLIDPDTIESTNLNRVVGAHLSDVGRPKVDVARDMVLSINDEALVMPRRADVCDAATARLLLDADFFFACTDTHGSRAVLAQISHQFLVPGIDLGVAIRATERGVVTHVVGRVQMLAPGLPCLVCSGVLDSEEVRRDLLTQEERDRDPYIIGARVPQPAVISINGAVAAHAVTMMLSAVIGVPMAARHQQLRFEHGSVRRVQGEPRPGCPICSPSGAALRGDTWARPGRRV